MGFLDNPSTALQQRILLHMNAWGKWANVKFSLSNSGPQIRIARVGGADGGYWSYVGTDVLHIPSNQQTMNLEGFTMDTPDSEFYRVVRHETGHTLGFPHEHLRKEIVGGIDVAKAIAYFQVNDGWSAAETTAQVLTPLDDSDLRASAIDGQSIMCYWLPGSIMKNGEAVPGGTDIDALDAYFADQIYPAPNTDTKSIWPNGKAYFFKGSKYTRYDPVRDKADPGYPVPIAGNWRGFPAAFAAGIDAWLLWNNGKAYFFKGDQYLRYDVATDKVDAGYPAPIAANWKGLNVSKVDAAVRWPNGKAYFFSGSKYYRYDVSLDQVDSGYPVTIQGNWNGLEPFASGIDAAVVWPNGKAYFFKGTNYIRFDIASDKADPGYPKPISAGWPGLWTSDLDA